MISIIVPIYNEHESIPPLFDKLLRVLRGIGRPFEIIAVNDGSDDDSAMRLRQLAHITPEVRVINFRRNYGQTAAMMAGIDHARGEVILPIDADLQNDP